MISNLDLYSLSVFCFFLSLSLSPVSLYLRRYESSTLDSFDLLTSVLSSLDGYLRQYEHDTKILK